MTYHRWILALCLAGGIGDAGTIYVPQAHLPPPERAKPQAPEETADTNESATAERAPASQTAAKPTPEVKDRASAAAADEGDESYLEEETQ